MINSINAAPGLMITGGSSQPYFNMQQPSAGLTRYNANSQRLEVYDGTVWLQMGSHPTIQFTPDVQEILTWAENKMREEQALEQRMKQHPGLRDAYEKFRVMDVLTAKYQGSDSESEGMAVQVGP